MSAITCPTSTRARRSPTPDILVLKRPNSPSSDETRKSARVRLERDHKNAQRRGPHDISSRRNARSLDYKRPAPPVQQPSNPATLVLSKARSPAPTPPHTQGPLLSMFQQPTDAPATQPVMHPMTRTPCEVRQKRPAQRPPPGKPPLLLQPRVTTPAKNATGTADKRRALRRVTGDVSSVKKVARTDTAPAKAIGRDASAQAKKTVVAAKLAKASAAGSGNIYFPPKAIQQPADSATPPIEADIVRRDPVEEVPAKVEIDVRVTSQEKAKDVKQEGSPVSILSTSNQLAIEQSSPFTPHTQLKHEPVSHTQVPSEVVPLDLLGELKLALAKRGMLKAPESHVPAPIPESADESPARKLIDRINKLKAQRALGDITNLRNPVVQEKLHKTRALVQPQPVILQHFEERPIPRPGESGLDANTWNILTKAGVDMRLVAAQTRTPAHVRRVKSPPLRACDLPFCGGQVEHEVEGLRHMKLVSYRGELISSVRAFGGNGPANLEDQGDNRELVTSLRGSVL